MLLEGVLQLEYLIHKSYSVSDSIKVDVSRETSYWEGCICCHNLMKEYQSLWPSMKWEDNRKNRFFTLCHIRQFPKKSHGPKPDGDFKRIYGLSHSIQMQFTRAYMGTVMPIFTRTPRFSGRPYVRNVGEGALVLTWALICRKCLWVKRSLKCTRRVWISG